MDEQQLRAWLDDNVRPGSLQDVYVGTPGGLWQITEVYVDGDGDVIIKTGEEA